MKGRVERAPSLLALLTRALAVLVLAQLILPLGAEAAASDCIAFFDRKSGNTIEVARNGHSAELITRDGQRLRGEATWWRANPSEIVMVHSSPALTMSVRVLVPRGRVEATVVERATRPVAAGS